MNFKPIKNIFLGILIIFMGMTFTACSDDEPLKPSEPQSLILIYAVAANNLYPDFRDDCEEILEGARTLDMINNKVLVYSVNPYNECVLQEVVKSGNTCSFQTVKTFSRLPLSVDPERIAEVMGYVNQNYSQFPHKGLVLWSHATGWLPWFGEFPDQRRSYGSDTYNGEKYQCNITDLADAIPENVFDFIWFDCCYMANIETVYQLREKADYIIGYVTEIYSLGMPYHLTLPYFIGSQPNLERAAETLFRYYDDANMAVTVSIMKTDALENLAEKSSVIFKKGAQPSYLSSIQNYSRFSGSPFYDMGQLLRSYLNLTEDEISDFDQAMGEAVIFKRASAFDFNHKPISQGNYSGLSIHNYLDNHTANSVFYASLDWFVDTRLK